MKMVQKFLYHYLLYGDKLLEENDIYDDNYPVISKNGS